MKRIPRYLMVTCQVCKGIKIADEHCHYCGAFGPIEGKYYNRDFIQMARAIGRRVLDVTKVIGVKRHAA